MPPRPAGTDGRDHSYREVIADRYKRMAQYKDSIEKLMMLHIAVMMVKVAWVYAADSAGGTGIPKYVMALIAGEVTLLVVYSMAKLGSVKESLPMLKSFNIIQSLITVTQILNGWVYHQGTNSGGVATYDQTMAMARFVKDNMNLPYSDDAVINSFKTFELFLDLTLTAFLIMATFVSHKMIVEKMEMKKDKKNAKTDRKDAQKGGSDDDGSEEGDDDGDAPAAVPLQEEKPKVIKAAATSKTAAARRRHA